MCQTALCSGGAEVEENVGKIIDRIIYIHIYKCMQMVSVDWMWGVAVCMNVVPFYYLCAD